MTHAEVLTIVTGLLAAYPRDVAEETLRVYAEDLRDCDPALLMQAVVTLRRTAKWLPTIAEVRRAVARLALPKAVAPAAAWVQAAALLASIGTYGSLGSRGGPYVNRALQLCGRWEDLCQEDMTWLRKRFVAIYEELVQGAQEQQQVTGTLPEWLAAPAVALLAPRDPRLVTLTQGLLAHMGSDDGPK